MLILASSSPYRKRLLIELGLNFKVCSPNIDETILPKEKSEHAVIRIAEKKANKVAQKEQGLIIASDQIGLLGNDILTKPLNHENAVLQLKKSSNKKVLFLTSLVLLNTKNNNIQTVLVKTTVFFKKLTNVQIIDYLLKEKPYDCAGSFKSEGLGVTLLDKIISEEPNALIGLPTIALTNMLIKENTNLV